MIGWALSAALLAVGPEVVVEGRLTTAAGESVRLSEFRGKPLLLFFEDRDSVGMNQTLKDRLFAEAKKRDLLHRVGLVAVAYLKPFDFFPARQFALAHVRSLVEQLGIDIFVDFKGSLAGPPLWLPTDSSTVLVVDRQGRVLYRHSGPHSEAEIERLVTLVSEEAVRS